MVDDRLDEIASGLAALGAEYERRIAEEQRRAEEEAEWKLRMERGWHALRDKRQSIIDEINERLSHTGFQLDLIDGLEVESAEEIDYFLLSIGGRAHPKLERIRLRVCLKENGFVAADVLTEGASQRLKRFTYEEFTIQAWRTLVIDHLEKVLAQD